MVPISLELPATWYPEGKRVAGGDPGPISPLRGYPKPYAGQSRCPPGCPNTGWHLMEDCRVLGAGWGPSGSALAARSSLAGTGVIGSHSFTLLEQ